MEEISGCDSASSNAIQARLACPWQFLTPSTLPLGLGCPHPNTSLSCVEGMGQRGSLPPSVGGWLRDSQANNRSPVLVPCCLWGALLMGWWRLLWLCHATNKQGRIFELSLVAGADVCAGEPWEPSASRLGWGLIRHHAGESPPADVPANPNHTVLPAWALGTGLLCFPKC